ncbi:Receptor protein kinase 5 [Spatholobus suberectus]|nr:Receptor protein kinase 5 [Spatholobus suberectus]
MHHNGVLIRDIQRIVKRVLLNIKQYLQDPPFLSHWTPNSSHCSWREITCTTGSVTALTLSHFNITKTIPSFICGLANLTHLDFSFNFIPGDFPTPLYNCSKLEFLDLSMNNFDGKVPLDIDRLGANLQYLNLSSTNFTGDVPASIGNLKQLRWLQLEYCLLNGTVAAEIENLSNLEYLDLSSNFILTNLNLSFNHLTGRIPNEFENPAYASSFLGNSGLCADTPALNLTSCNSSLQRTSKGSSWSIGLIISLVVVALLLALLASLLFTRFHRKRKQRLDNSWKLISFQRLNFTESSIVSSMTEQNIIGSGGYGTVYRVDVDGLGYVAVKRIWNNRKLDRKLESSFRAEVRILSNIRHTNIVRLMCCISKEDSMLLVYEYLENHSLDKWLHKKVKSLPVSDSVNRVVLDWPKRLKIAIGVAQGLSYMHHDCSPPVVHRDIKTSNILLDAQFNAKVADFGLARMLFKPGQLNTMSAVIGSFGYIAPEYVQTTRVSEKIDVFSFGVVLLELTTGKEANYGDQHSSLSEWAWRHVLIGCNVEEFLDKDVMEASYLDEMFTVFKLGVMCTATLPATRPSMKEALQILLSLGEPFPYGEEKNFSHYYDAIPLLKNSKRDTRLDVVDDSD